ncbi:c2H2-type domain-containing protein [Trichonephila clavata]|uniref:C2H2-type domain-containing protein n=1 Tax=Trichonephila clavata TaxID=2740835 RepID=A0A8X6HGK9_TRICU|nr:c2H2-type domain-containing protein [Trichonephila clavata]
MHPDDIMESKKKSSVGLNNLKNLKTTEKRCKKCGFVTFCLRVLYTHRGKCQGQLIGSLVCCYCKRKFNYLSLFKQHKRTCTKFNRKKSALIERNFKEIQSKQPKISKKTVSVAEQHTIACPVCLEIFSTREKYDVHVRKGSCDPKKPFKKQSFSARKSISKGRREVKQSLDYWPSDSEDPFTEYKFSSRKPTQKKSNIRPIVKKSDVFCIWCRDTFSSKQLFMKHIEKNYDCAAAFYLQNSRRARLKSSFTARKSFGLKQPIVARKSFSRFNHKKVPSAFNFKVTNGSARKSLPGTRKQIIKNAKTSFNSVKILNQCPVCYESFPDSFNFFQHQKRLNHWGKATKSTNNISKCPFCEKQFYHVRARNVHLRHHADKSEEEIELFLKNSTCDICSQIFASETMKYQHMKIEHPKVVFDMNTRENRKNDKQSLLPLVIKQKLKEYPNTCPICSKNFPSTYYRNKHFQKKHLDSELECKFCPQRYNSVEDLEYHMQKAHYNSFKFECLACKINLATAPHVVLHVTKVHADQDPKSIIRCRVNESVLMSESSYTSNELTRNISEKVSRDKEFYCDVCKVSFLRLCGLQSHRQSRSHRCTLEKSLDAMHKSLSDLPPSPPPLPKKQIKHPEILTCNECYEEFTTVKDFVPHRLSHFSVQGKYLKINEENFYTCEICGEISDSHSKVQLHLFWHLQVESTATEKSSVKVKGKNDPIVPDRLSGQQVAKKSFAKQSPKSQQEVVIGGVKKSLFTCEFCNIGFPTQSHYSLHVRKFCRMKPTPVKNYSKKETENKDSIRDETSSTHLPGISSLKKHIVNSQNTNLEHCTICNCLFSLALKETHENICEKCIINDSEINKDVNHIKSNMDLQSVVAACISCTLPFDNPQAFSEHMLACHKSASNSMSVKETDNSSKNTVHCTACNCLFFCSEALKNHNDFCSNSSCCDFDADSVTDILKAASKLENLTAACISCSLGFDSIQNFNEHMLLHQDTGLAEFKDHNKDNESSLNGPHILSGEESLSTNANSVISFDIMEHDSEEMENIVHKTRRRSSSEKSLEFASSLSNDSLWFASDSSKANQTSHSVISSAEKSDDSINKLRDNFSQLLCILINDPELMEHLGFGKQPVDDVLTKVLQKMGQTPVLKDAHISEIDCLRRNIRILLDFCLKDQIMELIGNGKTSTDEIVDEALKMFCIEKTSVASE